MIKSYSKGLPTEYYYNTGDTLPTTGVPIGAFALNTDTWEISVFNGTTWVVKE